MRAVIEAELASKLGVLVRQGLDYAVEGGRFCEAASPAFFKTFPRGAATPLKQALPKTDDLIFKLSPAPEQFQV